MESIKIFKSVFQLHSENPLLHYAYASCLHLALQYKSVYEEMKECIKNHPNFIPAKLALEGWERWINLEDIQS